MAGNIISSMAFLPPTPPRYDRDLAGLFFVGGVAGMMYPPHLPYKMTILYSHGNAVDIGFDAEYMRILSDKLGVNMVAYDYEGYGLTGGKASEGGCYRSCETIWRYLLDTVHVNPTRLIVAGRSLGSGPAIDLATKQQVAGLLLISPFLSATRAVLPESSAIFLRYSDIFINIDKIDKVSCPVMIVHGFADDVVPWKHGSQLAQKCRNLWKMVTITTGTHNNRATTLGAVDEIAAFIRHVDDPVV